MTQETVTESKGKRVTETYVVRHIHDGRIFYSTGADDGAECSGTESAKPFDSESSAQATADRLNINVPQYSWHAVTVAQADDDDAANNAAWAARESA